MFFTANRWCLVRRILQSSSQSCPIEMREEALRPGRTVAVRAAPESWLERDKVPVCEGAMVS